MTGMVWYDVITHSCECFHKARRCVCCVWLSGGGGGTGEYGFGGGDVTQFNTTPLGGVGGGGSKRTSRRLDRPSRRDRADSLQRYAVKGDRGHDNSGGYGEAGTCRNVRMPRLPLPASGLPSFPLTPFVVGTVVDRGRRC